MFNVGFLSSGVTRACLNAVGKMPVRRDVLIMCVSAGKSVGEIAWRRCEWIGSRGHVVGWLEIRFVYFCLCEGTEGEEGSFSNRCVWFEFLHVWNWLLIELVLFVKKVAKPLMEVFFTFSHKVYIFKILLQKSKLIKLKLSKPDIMLSLQI